MESIGSDSIYEYLYRCIKTDILQKRLKPGERLPSKRSFAKNMQISVITVENAYAQLQVEGYIYSIEKKGYYVADIAGNLPEGAGASFREYRTDQISPIQHNQRKNTALWDRKELAEAKKELAGDKKYLEEKQTYFMDFVSNTIHQEDFPFSVWSRLMRDVISSGEREELLHRAPVCGVEKLRIAIAGHLYAFRGMQVEPNQIIIGAGTEYLYNLIIQLLGREKVFAVEDPGYTKITEIYRSNDVTCVHIPMDDAGVVLEELEESQAEILHISPSHHFPTGIVMPVSRRYDLLSWASKSDSRYIIEDDYDCELRLFGRPIPALQSIDVMEKVIYMNTFSKSLAPSFRISYMVLPKHLMERYRDTLGFYSCTVSNFEQYTLAEFILQGYFEKHINRMRNLYRDKRDTILQIIKESPLASMVRIHEEDSGLHFLMEIDTPLSDTAITKEAARNGIRLSSVSEYYYLAQNRKEHVFIINYSGVDEERMQEAVRRLCGCLGVGM